MVTHTKECWVTCAGNYEFYYVAARTCVPSNLCFGWLNPEKKVTKHTPSSRGTATCSKSSSKAARRESDFLGAFSPYSFLLDHFALCRSRM